jgi:uncharacterized membrane protein YfcA
MHEITHLILMFLLSLGTAIMSAATGMGGGVIFLVGLNVFMPLDKVIPIHGLIQLKNNALRVWVLRAFLKKELCIPFFFGCLIGVGLVTYLASLITSKLIPFIIIFLLVNYSIFKPKKMPELKLNKLGFGILGIFTGFLGILIGAVDPILSPFFVREDFIRQEVIANKSFFQSLVHLSKIPVFLSFGFNYLEHWQLILILFIGGIIGTALGIRLLNYISQSTFKIIFKSILFLVGIKLAYNIYNLLTQA